ncbi:MAG: DUF1028 domain-containing protein [Anaerolineae bacterium]|nr:DUF1028 domain-containing protein [Anaerolineae bacterium]
MDRSQRCRGTFSIVAYDPQAEEWGIAVQSKFLAVGSAVPWASAGVGAVATQSWANTSYGPRGLAMMEQGMSAQEVVTQLTEEDKDRALRQVGVVDAQGHAAAFTGEDCLDWAGHIVGQHYTCQGNILVSGDTVQAMAQTFEASAGSLVDRLIEALRAGQDAGGDRRGQQSAALLVVREKGGYGGFNDRYVDLRVDDHPAPIAELARLLKLHQLYFGEPDEDNLIPIRGDVLTEIQHILRRTGYYDGPATTTCDEQTKKALQNLISIENLEERWRDDDLLDAVILDFLRNRFGRE